MAILNSGLSDIASVTRIVTPVVDRVDDRKVSKGTVFRSVFDFIKELNRKRIERRRLTKSRKLKKNEIENYMNNVKETIETPFDDGVLKILKSDDVLSIHVHNVIDACRLKNCFTKNNFVKTVILTLHTPESFADEIINGFPEGGGDIRTECYSLLRGLERQAIEFADYYIFPSAESLEPFKQTVPGFDNLIDYRKIYYVPTGSKDLFVDADRETVRDGFGIGKDDFVVSFIGRHISVKGYDVLKEAAKILMNEDGRLRFYIAGKPLNIDLDLNAPFWNELGYVNPRNLLKASDCFVLPNRRTFYDLVLLEALSSGAPIIVSETGGNKSVIKECESLKGFACDDFASKNLADQIKAMIARSKDERANLGRMNRQNYVRNHTPVMFAENYNRAVVEIQRSLEG